MHELPSEEWRNVPGRPLLQASSHGRIRTLGRIGKMGTREYRTNPTFGVITSAAQNARHVYFSRYIRHIGNVKVHRAVCLAFHGEPTFERAVVIHLNENSLDNRPANLKWGTQKENLNMPRFKEYNRLAKKVLVKTDPKSAPRTADIYIGIPQLVEELTRRKQQLRR